MIRDEGMRLTYARTEDRMRKRHSGEIQVEGIQRDSFLKRSLRWAGEALGVLAVGGLPFYACTPPPHRIVFEEQKITGELVRDSSATRDTAAALDSSASGASAAYVAPAQGNSLIPDNSIYFKEASNFVPFRFSDTGATFLIAENQLCVSFRDEASDENISNVQQWLTGQGASKTGEIVGLKMMQYEVNPGTDLNALLNHLKEQPGVLTALPNFVIHPARNPDPNPAGTVYDGYWWIDRIRLREAWNVTTGSADIPVAVIDDGVALNCGHFDGKNIRLGFRCKKPDGKVYYSDQIKSTNECEAHMPGPHGTEVAGILAARGDDGRGCVGVAWENPLISIDLWGREGVQTVYQANAAIECAIDMGARVLNLSYSAAHHDNNGKEIPGPTTLEETTTFRSGLVNAMSKAHQKNVLVVLCAGNDGFKNDDTWLPPNFPTSDVENFKSNALVVGGFDDWNDPFCGSDYVVNNLNPIVGPLCNGRRLLNRCQCFSCNDFDQSTHDASVEGRVVEISAPAYHLALPDWKRTDASVIITSGTSFAAPMVAGAAALVLSQHPEYTPAQVKDILLTSADPSTGCRQIGHGILNIAAALGATIQPWNKTYPEYHLFYSVKQTIDRALILTAAPSSIVKINSQGSVLWSHALDQDVKQLTNYVREVIETSDGGYVAVGDVLASFSPNCTRHGLLMIKVDANGNSIWTREITAADKDRYAFSVQETASGDLVVAGGASQGMLLMRTDADGNVIWEKRIKSGVEDAYAHSVQVTSDGGYLFSGTDGGQDVLVKTDADGSVLWEKAYGKKGADVFRISKKTDGSFVGITSNREILNIANGDVEWRMNLGGPYDYLKKVIQTQDGDFIVVGQRLMPSNENAAVLLFKVDKNGKLQWDKHFVTSGCGVVSEVQEMSDGGFIIVGNNSVYRVTRVGPPFYSFSGGTGWLIKTDKNGNSE